jgi:hypothetical protein
MFLIILFTFFFLFFLSLNQILLMNIFDPFREMDKSIISNVCEECVTDISFNDAYVECKVNLI